jgi:hypothetical protein
MIDGIDVTCKAIADGAWQCFWGSAVIFCLLGVFLSGAMEKEFKIPILPIAPFLTMLGCIWLMIKEMIRCGYF